MLCGKLKLIPTKEEYKNETKDLSEEDKQQYDKERELDEASKNLQEKLERID